MYSINMTGHIKCAPIFSCLPVACFDATLSGRGDYVDAIVAPGEKKIMKRRNRHHTDEDKDTAATSPGATLVSRLNSMQSSEEDADWLRSLGNGNYLPRSVVSAERREEKREERGVYVAASRVSWPRAPGRP